MLAMIGIFIGSANLSNDGPRQQVAAAFADGTLSFEIYRMLEPVPGFIVAESDSNSSCVMYALMLSSSSDVFGRGIWSDPVIPTCEGLAVAVNGGPTMTFPWFRYWQGASAITKVALTFVSVYVWQLFLTGLLALLLALLILHTWRFSRTFSLGVAVSTLMTTDLVWQGLSVVHGVSASIGLLFTLLAGIAFSRRWPARWGIVVLAGATYAMVAQMLIPMAFAILISMMAMLPILRTRTAWNWRQVLVGPLAGCTWVGGYVLGLLSRYVWVATFGPGLDELRAEVNGTSGVFLTKSLLDPFYQVVGLLTKTWLNVGFMQVGLMLFFLVLGWSLARGGASGYFSKAALVSLSPTIIGISWLLVWATHTNHTFVHVLLAMILLNVLFASEVGRAVSRCRLASIDPAQESLVRSTLTD
jgi:hypothetical protein